jgi:hypothetical protein
MANGGDITGPGLGNPDDECDVLDIPAIVNRLKTVSPLFPEPRLWLKQNDPNPVHDPINVLDLSQLSDVLFGETYSQSFAGPGNCP